MSTTNETPDKRPAFGARHLTSDSDVFSHNAWDNVEWNSKQEAAAEASIAANSEIRLSSEELSELERSAGSKWDAFYGIHQNRFFKDRNWLFTEFPELRTQEKAILEMGCGVGNTVYPLLETNTSQDLKIFCCDFSSKAVEILKEHPAYTSDARVKAFVCDVTDPTSWTTQAPFPPGSIHIMLAIFVLSALDPSTLDSAVANMSKYLAPGGVLLFRDYGRGDLAQLRFKPGKCLGKDFYMRGDGTRCLFFSQDGLREVFERNGFKEIESRVDRRLQVNRGKQLKMYRIWIQAKFQKTGGEEERS